MTEGVVTLEDDTEAFVQTLHDAAEALERAGVPHVVFGSVATTRYGRPGSSGDIDLLVRPQDADGSLDALAGADFHTERTDPRWIYKATKRDVLVDVIFRVKGDIHLDEEMIARSVVEELAGAEMRLIAPEDSLVIEAVSHEAQAPEHWHNALAIISETELDWNYVVRRARHSARRVLSLLIYAESNDLVVPQHAIETLFARVYR
jgi:predicted nucleotidyltransferase